VTLLTRAKAGDHRALELLLARYRPRLRRWAHRRLPPWARSLADTEDLVQDALMRTVRNLDSFVVQREGGLQSYLRLAIANAVRDEIRKARRRPSALALDPELPSEDASPLDHAMGQRRLERYEAALRRLSPEEREVVVARLEFGFTHGELALALGKSTPDAARKTCRKALDLLLALMRQPAD
jgi:RNA polymerase sigma-70 factor (ECF subfamily)